MTQHRVNLLLEQMDYTTGQGGWFRNLEAGLEELTASQAAWSPGNGVNSIWETISHLAFWKEILANRMAGAPMTGGRISNDATFRGEIDPTDDAAWAAAVARLRDAHRAFRAGVAALTDEQLDLPLEGERTPLGETLKAMNVHDGYHLGQIVLLRKWQSAWPASR